MEFTTEIFIVALLQYVNGYESKGLCESIAFFCNLALLLNTSDKPLQIAILQDIFLVALICEASQMSKIV